jgi:hypothetical protein
MGGLDLPEKKAKGPQYNRCKHCGTYVKRGIKDCPECRAEIVDQYGVAAFLFSTSEQSIGAVIGMVASLLPVAVIGLVLNDPTVGTLALSSDEVKIITLMCVLLGAVVGWNWTRIVTYLREHGT